MSDKNIYGIIKSFTALLLLILVIGVINGMQPNVNELDSYPIEEGEVEIFMRSNESTNWSNITMDNCVIKNGSVIVGIQ